MILHLKFIESHANKNFPWKIDFQVEALSSGWIINLIISRIH